MRRLLPVVLLLLAITLPPAPVRAAECVSSVGPGIAPPPGLRTGLAGYHAAWYGQSGYLSLCPGARATATVAYLNTGSLGWYQGVLGRAAYLGTWDPEPNQDQPSVLGGDGALGSPRTGWPRFNRPATQPAAYVGPGQVAWFQFDVVAPTEPGTYRLGIRPLVEGAQWMEDQGVYWEITVLRPDGSAPAPRPMDPRGLYYQVDAGVLAQDILEVHEGVARASAWLDAFVGDRTTPAHAHIYPGNGTQRYCCLATGARFEIVTRNPAWTDPPAAGASTWSASVERRELAAHEYVHVWQYAVGGSSCMLTPRWLAEGMAESFAYRAMIAGGLIEQARLDGYVRERIRTGQHMSLASLESSFPDAANPFQLSYLAFDRVLAPSGAQVRDFCTRIGPFGVPWRTAFAGVFGQSVDTFYARFEVERAAFIR